MFKWQLSVQSLNQQVQYKITSKSLSFMTNVSKCSLGKQKYALAQNICINLIKLKKKHI